MEDSIISKRSLARLMYNEVNYALTLNQQKSQAIKVGVGDDFLVASLVIIESLLSKQSKTDS